MALLENIQYLCEEHGTSVPKLEQTLQFGKGTIYKWSKSSPTADKLQKVATYFSVSTDYLLGRMGPDLMNINSVIATTISEIRGNMSDKEFSDALNAFTNGEYHPDLNTIQKYRTGQMAPRIGDLQIILAYGKAGNRVSLRQITRLANFFSIPQLAQQPEELAIEIHTLQAELEHLHQSGRSDELAQTHLNDLRQVLQMITAQQYISDFKLHSVRNEFGKLIEIPIFEQIPINEHVESEDNPEGYMTIPTSALIGNDAFYLKAPDDAFDDVGIRKGDLVLLRKFTLAKNGQTVVARLSNQEIVCKKLFKTEDGNIILLPAAADFQPINPSEIEIIGIVEEVLRNY